MNPRTIRFLWMILFAAFLSVSCAPDEDASDEPEPSDDDDDIENDDDDEAPSYDFGVPGDDDEAPSYDFGVPGDDDDNDDDILIETIATGDAMNPDIAIDSQNHLHISYCAYEEPYCHVTYLSDAAGEWISDPIETILVHWNSVDTAIAVDSGDQPHISYVFLHVRHASKQAGEWFIETVSSDLGTSEDIEMALDEDNVAHISFGDLYLSYATNASGSWETTVVEEHIGCSSVWVGSYNSIAVDSLGRPHIAYQYYEFSSWPDYEYYYLHYANTISGDWDHFSLGSGGLSTSIALDAMDRIHMVHFDNYLSGNLWYRIHGTGHWAIDQGGTGSSLSLDGDGFAHICYWRVQDDSFTYATNMHGSWVYTPFHVSHHGSKTSTAIGGDGRIHVVYRIDDGSLCHASIPLGHGEKEE